MFTQQDLARVIVNYSCDVKQGECVYLNVFGNVEQMVEYVKQEISLKGGKTIVRLNTYESIIETIRHIDEEKAYALLKKELAIINKCECFITLVGEDFAIPTDLFENNQIYERIYKKGIRDARIEHCKWIGLKLPNAKMAENAEMTLEEFEQFYYNICCIDYNEMKMQNQNLLNRLRQADVIKIVAPGTELEFRKAQINSHLLCGEMNMPDGEIYTAPVKNSVNGYITFNVASHYQGVKFENIKLWFENGKVVSSMCNVPDYFERIINSDEGARYIGEFAIGTNSYIHKSIGIGVYDEKIKGSVHFALGQSYPDAYNGNDSQIHWDLVLDLNEKSGGGQVYFDGNLVCENGKWLL